MPLDPKRKSACKAAIVDHLEHTGSQGWDQVRRDFEDIPIATWWRWVAAAKALVLDRKVRALGARADELAGDGLRAIADALPTVPSIGSLCADTTLDPSALLYSCLLHAGEVVAHARGPDGKVRNPKLLLAGSRHIVDVLRTAAAISSTLLDERQARAFYKALMAEMEAESPEFAARVTARFEAFNNQMGLRSYVGR